MAFPVVVVVAAAAAAAGIPIAVEAEVGPDSAVGEDHTHWGQVGVEGLERGDSGAGGRGGSCLGKMKTRHTRNCGRDKTVTKGWEDERLVWLRDVRWLRGALGAGMCPFKRSVCDGNGRHYILCPQCSRVRLIPSVARNTSISMFFVHKHLPQYSIAAHTPCPHHTRPPAPPQKHTQHRPPAHATLSSTCRGVKYVFHVPRSAPPRSLTNPSSWRSCWPIPTRKSPSPPAHRKKHCVRHER